MSNRVWNEDGVPCHAPVATDATLPNGEQCWLAPSPYTRPEICALLCEKLLGHENHEIPDFYADAAASMDLRHAINRMRDDGHAIRVGEHYVVSQVPFGRASAVSPIAFYPPEGSIDNTPETEMAAVVSAALRVVQEQEEKTQ